MAAGRRALLRSSQGCRCVAFGDADRLQQHPDAGALAWRQLGQMAAEGARPRPAVVEAQNMPHDVVEPPAVRTCRSA